jgi:hypothetical protein
MSVSEGNTGTATSSRVMRADYLKQIIQHHAVPAGQGVPAGGTAGQVLAKVDGTDYNTEWIDAPGGGGIEWETVQYEEEKTIPTESFYWHIPDTSRKTPSASNLELMPFLQSLGRFWLGGDIYFKREYYDNSTSYMDTMVFASSSNQTIIFHHEEGGKWINEPVKWADYSLSAEYNSGTGEYDFTLSTSSLTLKTNQWRWFKHILINDLGTPDVYIALTTNTLITSGGSVFTPKAINCKMDLFTTYHSSTTPTAEYMYGTIKPIVSCNRSGYAGFVDYLLSIHFEVDNAGKTDMISWKKIKLA